jgi:cytochrome c biogenesis protein
MDAHRVRDAAVKPLLKTIASLKLTLAGLAALIVNSFAISQWPDAAMPWLVLPLSVLALNLFAALLVRHSFRQQAALLLFHVGLLAVLLLVAAGVLVRFDGSVEVVEGTAYDAAVVTDRGRGWLHPDRLHRVQFSQGPLEVNFLAGLQRDTTHSRVAVTRPDGIEVLRDIGDRQGFASHGYRFMTTFNKGYSVLLLWRDAAGNEALGTVNFPSFPEFEWKQRKEWTTPAGERLAFELELVERVPEESPWTLRSRGADFEVGVSRSAGAQQTIGPGESIAVTGGEITIVDLRLWMGYRIDYNPLLPWLLTAAFLSLGALAVHMAQKFRMPRVAEPVRVNAGEQAV